MTANPRHSFRFQLFICAAIVLLSLATLVVTLVTAQQSTTEPLTGNWAVRTLNNDGTFRTTYLNLRQEGMPRFEVLPMQWPVMA